MPDHEVRQFQQAFVPVEIRFWTHGIVLPEESLHLLSLDLRCVSLSWQGLCCIVVIGGGLEYDYCHLRHLADSTFQGEEVFDKTSALRSTGQLGGEGPVQHPLTGAKYMPHGGFYLVGNIAD